MLKAAKSQHPGFFKQVQQADNKLDYLEKVRQEYLLGSQANLQLITVYHQRECIKHRQVKLIEREYLQSAYHALRS